MREIVAKVAIASLLHASRHGDASHAANLLIALPNDGERASLAMWFNKHTPIHVGANNGKIFARLRKVSNPDFRPLNLPNSKTALREALLPGLRFANLPEGSFLSKRIADIELHFGKRPSQPLSALELKKAALKALVHAKAHGDVTRMKLLTEGLSNLVWSGGFRAWLYRYSPIRRDRKSGRWHQAKPVDPDYRPYDIEGATKAAVVGNSSPSLNTLSRDDVFAKWEHDLQGASHEELFEAFKSCSDSIVDGKLTGDPRANRTILAISSEWLRRRTDDDYFTWPSTDASPGLIRLGSIEAPDLGVLAALGYRVGKVKGQPTEIRRFILDYVFQSHLPPINNAEYMAQWDAPSSPRRLKKMANAVATFVRNFKRLDSHSHKLAITQWSDDLDYLYHSYYIRTFGFAWPDVTAKCR